MRKLIIVAVLIFTVISLIAKKLEVVNPNRPDVNTTTLTLEISYPLHEDFDLFMKIIMKNDKIYSLNRYAKMVVITDLQGQLFDLIDVLGNGPGEFQSPFTIFNDIPNNRLGISDLGNRRCSYFDFDSNYIEDVRFESMQSDLSFHYCNDAKIRYYQTIKIDEKKGNMVMSSNVEVMGGKDPVEMFKVEFDPSGFYITDGMYPMIATSNTNVYITSCYCIDGYKIQVFNSDGLHKMDIIKDYKKTRYSQKELQEKRDKLGDDFDPDNDLHLFKTSIRGIIVDNKEQLWVSSFDDIGSLWDIYNDDGKIISQARIKDHRFGHCQFYKGKFYEFISDEEDEDLYILNVYRVD